MAVDYVAHMSEAYLDAPYTDRRRRAKAMLARCGISVLSGAISTLGATMFLFFAYILFFGKEQTPHPNLLGPRATPYTLPLKGTITLITSSKPS